LWVLRVIAVGIHGLAGGPRTDTARHSAELRPRIGGGKERCVVRMSRAPWGRAMIALAAATIMIAAAVVGGRVLMSPAVGRAPAVVPVDISEPGPLSPPPPGFPDLNGFTDVSQSHELSRSYVLATFTSPTGLQCSMWSSLGDTAAFCFGAIPGLDHPANQVYAGDHRSAFDQGAPPDSDKLNGKPLASGEKVILGAGGTLMGGDQITCGVQNALVACIVIEGFSQNHGDDTAQRHGFVLNPQRSWTF
jgi:hypothetical protein